MNQLDKLNSFKTLYLSELANVPTFKENWNHCKSEIEEILDGSQDLLKIGENLSNIFRSIPSSRSQSAVAKAGAMWECLVSWYLNLIFWNTNVLSIKWKKSFIPKLINDALTVTVRNISTTSEADLVSYSVPLFSNYEIDNLDGINEAINNEIGERRNELFLNVMQLKVNWNENSQIPMLWDFVYNSEDVNIPYVQVGKNGYHPNIFDNFSYSFTTVPTKGNGNLESYKIDGVNTQRVANLTGGNYWGYETKRGVSSNINEYFMRNFRDSFKEESLNSHINKNLTDTNYLDKFLNLNF